MSKSTNFSNGLELAFEDLGRALETGETSEWMDKAWIQNVTDLVDKLRSHAETQIDDLDDKLEAADETISGLEDQVGSSVRINRTKFSELVDPNNWQEEGIRWVWYPVLIGSADRDILRFLDEVFPKEAE